MVNTVEVNVIITMSILIGTPIVQVVVLAVMMKVEVVVAAQVVLPEIVLRIR